MGCCYGQRNQDRFFEVRETFVLFYLHDAYFPCRHVYFTTSQELILLLKLEIKENVRNDMFLKTVLC